MNQKKRSNILYASKILIPLIIVIGLFLGGISTGIITFEQKPKAAIFNPNDNLENQASYINATMEIDFGDGVEYSKIFNLEENLTVFDFLLIIKETGEIDVGYTYWEQYDNYFIDSITYNNKEYEGDSSHYWAFLVNGESAMEGADKIYVYNNDTIRWEYVQF